MSAKHLSSADFSAATKSGVALIDFWAPWCGPCRALGPVIDQLAGEFDGKALVAKINCDEEAALAGQFGVQAIPTVLIMKDGAVVEQFTGVKAKATLANAITQALAN